jgi:hypothetical protein
MSQATPTANEIPVERRNQKLIKRDIQVRLGLIFAGVSTLCLLIQWLLLSSLLANAAHKMPVGGDYLLDLVPTLLTQTLLLSAAIALPLTLVAGIYATFRITGPIHRFETYLREVIRGTQLGPCKIRQGDALLELCELINDATEPIRKRQYAPANPAPEGDRKAA